MEVERTGLKAIRNSALKRLLKFKVDFENCRVVVNESAGNTSLEIWFFKYLIPRPKSSVTRYDHTPQ